MKQAETKAQLNKRGWFIKFNKRIIHYFSGGRSLCRNNVRFDLSLKPTIITKPDPRLCKSCESALCNWSDLDNFDFYNSD